jgi:hypothetical protein
VTRHFQSQSIASLIKFAVPLTTAFVVLIFYILTLQDDITWAYLGGDGGELIAASYTLGIPHPPGYPAYVLFGKLFSLIPIGTIAFRYNLFSAVSMAVAAGFVSAIAAKKSNIPQADNWVTLSLAAAGIACGLTFAFVPVVWQQSLITEVYALNALFLAALLWAVLTKRPPVLIGILYGLSITGHLTSILFAPLLLLLVPKKSWLSLAVGSLFGLLPLLALPVLHNSGSPVSWGEPTTFEGWWWLVSGRLYRPNAFSLFPLSWPAKIAGWGLTVILPLIGLTVTTALGLALPEHKVQRRPAAIILATAMLFAGYALAYDTGDSSVYLIPAFLLLSVNIGLFLPRLRYLALILPLFMLIIASPLYTSPPTLGVRTAAGELLDTAPENAILLTGGDQTVAALWYFQHVEGLRTDIAIVDENMFQFPWYRQRLQESYPYLTRLEEDDVPGFVLGNQQDRPVCRVSLVGQGYISCGDSQLTRDS